MGKAGIYARLSLADEKSTSTRRQEKECSDPEHQATAATATIATSNELIVTEVTLAECAHVLRAVYRTPDNVIAAVIRSLIAQPNISVEHPESATTTLELLETSGLGYTDANLAATALTMEVAVCSFDRGLDRITGLRRNEPV